MTKQGSTLAGKLAVLAALCGLAGLPASADWLVTREGAKVETKGPWQVKGKLVVFHLADGSLSSLRLAEVDLEASRKAMEEAERAKAEAEETKNRPAERKAPVLVVTDKDVRHVDPATVSAAAAPGEAAAVDSLAVSNWDRAPDPGDGHVVITGTLTNNSSTTTATGITLTVVLVDEAGNPLGTAQAIVTSNVLPPGQQSGFRAEFPSVFTFSNLKFEPKSIKLETAPEPAPAANGG